MGSEGMMTYDEVTVQLYKHHSHDAAHDAIVALLTRDASDSPVPEEKRLTFARAIATRSRIDAHRYRYHRNGGRTLDSVEFGLDSTGDHGQYGVIEPTQLRRLEARETLETLHPVDMMKGLGYLDPPPQDPPANQRRSNPERDRWTQRQRRKPRS